MERLPIPFNITLLNLTDNLLRGIIPVTSLDIFDQNKQLHERGLFSTVIFGKVGDDARNTRFSYIDVKIPILHPMVFRAIKELKEFHSAIILGTVYAKWNPVLKDFEKSNLIEGDTGFTFFLKHFKEIEYVPNKSTARDQNILLVKKYRDTALTSKIIVMPAGYRDVEIDSNGRVSLDEINSFYQTLLGIANTITPSMLNTNIELLNKPRTRLQLTFNSLFEHIENMIQGKKKLILSGWASRSVFNGTRNVITAMSKIPDQLGTPNHVDMNTSYIGLFQVMKAYLPICQYRIRNTYLQNVFSTLNTPANLINPKTLKQEKVMVSPETFDRWNTDMGIEKIISAYSEESIRHNPVVIEGYYLGLIYKGKGNYRFLQSIEELPPYLDKKDVSPITLTEFLFISIYKDMEKYPLFMTRYPITGVGSIYPSHPVIRTTVNVEERVMLDDNWEATDDIAYNFPIRGGAFFNSLSPSSFRLGRAGADFDGDMMSGNGTYSDEAINEVDKFFKLKRAYVGVDGRFINTTNTDTAALLFHNLTGDPR